MLGEKNDTLRSMDPILENYMIGLVLGSTKTAITTTTTLASVRDSSRSGAHVLWDTPMDSISLSWKAPKGSQMPQPHGQDIDDVGFSVG